MLRCALITLLVYVSVVIPAAIILSGPFVVLLLPALMPYEGVRRVLGAPDIRFQRLLRRFASNQPSRQPFIVETRVFPGLSPNGLDGYVVCESDRDLLTLSERLPELFAAIAQAISSTRPLGRAVSLVAVSHEAVARQGGWFGYRHNVESSMELRYPSPARLI